MTPGFQRSIEWVIWLAGIGIAVGLSYGALSARVSACEGLGREIAAESDRRTEIIIDIRERVVRLETKMDQLINAGRR
jgi:hypothetical protein